MLCRSRWMLAPKSPNDLTSKKRWSVTVQRTEHRQLARTRKLTSDQMSTSPRWMTLRLGRAWKASLSHWATELQVLMSAAYLTGWTPRWNVLLMRALRWKARTAKKPRPMSFREESAAAAASRLAAAMQPAPGVLAVPVVPRPWRSIC